MLPCIASWCADLDGDCGGELVAAGASGGARRSLFGVAVMGDDGLSADDLADLPAEAGDDIGQTEVVIPPGASAEVAAGLRMAAVRVPALDALPIRQRVFVNHYMSNGFRPKDAAMAAGWSESGAGAAGSRLLRDPGVVAAIEAALEAQGLARVRVLEGLAALSLSDMTDLVTWDAGGKALFKSVDDLPLHIRQSITKVKVDPETGRVIEVEMGSKVAALTALMKGLRMDKPAVQVNAAGPVQVVISGEDAAVL